MDINSRGLFIISVVSLLIIVSVLPANSAPHKKKNVAWMNPCGPHIVDKFAKNTNETFSLDALELSLTLTLKQIQLTSREKDSVYARCNLTNLISKITLKPKLKWSEYHRIRYQTLSKRSNQTNEIYRRLVFKMLKMFYKDQQCILREGFDRLISYIFSSQSAQISPKKRSDKLNDLKVDGSNLLCEIESSINNTMNKFNFSSIQCEPIFKNNNNHKTKTYEEVCANDIAILKAYKTHVETWKKIVVHMNANKTKKTSIKSQTKAKRPKVPLRHSNSKKRKIMAKST